MSERLHPDPDALNAFVEGALAEHDRVECLAHLADCSQCRDVVFLAQKAAEIEEPVEVAPVEVAKVPVSFWRRLLRPMAVTFVAATAIVAVFSFGLHRLIRSAERQPELTASTKARAKGLPAKVLPIDTAPAAQAEKQTPELQPAPRTIRPQPVPKEQEQPPASPAPAAAAPPVVAAAPPPPPPPAPVAAAAQVAEGASVVGTITDPAGAVISSARVELKNENTGATYASTSDVSGQYRIAGLAGGRYDLSVTSPGFKSFVRTGINVQPQEIARLDSALSLGAVTETVTVTAEAPLLKTESGGISHQADSPNALPLLPGARGSVRAVAGSSPAYILPDKSTPVSVATKGKLVVAANSAGALLVSENAGKTWARLKATWKGKVVRVSVRANAMFELTTDSTSTWVSTDGRHWSEAHTPR